jgi:hypothetical protein
MCLSGYARRWLDELQDTSRFRYTLDESRTEDGLPLHATYGSNALRSLATERPLLPTSSDRAPIQRSLPQLLLPFFCGGIVLLYSSDGLTNVSPANAAWMAGTRSE